MFWKLYKHSSVHNILVITLSNIGDVLLTGPVMDILLRDFPQAKLSLVTSPKAAFLFEGNPRIHQVHIFDKILNPMSQAKWTLNLRRYHYDVVVDLRNSMIGYFLFPRWITPPVLSVDKKFHLKDQHLNRLRALYDFDPDPAPSLAIAPSFDDKLFVDEWLKPFLGGSSSFVVVAPRAADSAKTWDSQNFVHFINAIISQYSLKIVMIGSQDDRGVIEDISRQVTAPILNLAGRISLIQTVALLKGARIVVAHDSGPMHIASYLNKPLVALFGPTDPVCSCPWSSIFKVVCRNSQCPRCLSPRLSIPHNCMAAITVEDVLQAFGEVYGST
ncbi:MAG: glycosyltransferase family 9 protein [Candidatus Omnitrophica bacterium]|nr:glycosyltransferase family 9 protein [Candidatus Omnitrophota bacterium]